MIRRHRIVHMLRNMKIIEMTDFSIELDGEWYGYRLKGKWSMKAIAQLAVAMQHGFSLHAIQADV